MEKHSFGKLLSQESGFREFGSFLVHEGSLLKTIPRYLH